MPNQQWIDHAYPLQLITVQVQGTRHSDRKDMVGLLRKVADLIEGGSLSDWEEDDDFGYRYSVTTDEPESIFPAHGISQS